MDINEWRKKIDELDARLVELLNRRAHAAARIGELKRRDGRPLRQPARERAILRRVQFLNRGRLPSRALRRLFQQILREARAVERRGFSGR